MKTKLLLLTLCLVVLTSCQQKKDDPEVLKQILTDYFDGIKTQDINKLNSLTTDDFVLFEDGKIWTNDSLVTIKDKFKSFKGDWKFDNMKVNIDQSSGDITYYDHGEFVLNDTINMKFDWLESATFRKTDGKWKMNFLHSTVRK
jgi:ketosteroid isomerase-like protein